MSLGIKLILIGTLLIGVGCFTTAAGIWIKVNWPDVMYHLFD